MIARGHTVNSKGRIQAQSGLTQDPGSCVLRVSRGSTEMTSSTVLHRVLIPVRNVIIITLAFYISVGTVVLRVPTRIWGFPYPALQTFPDSSYKPFPKSHP